MTNRSEAVASLRPFSKGLQQRRLPAALLGAALGVAWFGTSGVAHASPEFPMELRAAADLKCTPTCKLCHSKNPGEGGTTRGDFVAVMIETGLQQQNPSSVAPAYEELIESAEFEMYRAQFQDEGGFDITQVPDYECDAEITHGCTAAAKPAPAPWGALALALLGLGLFGRRRPSKI